MKILFIHSLMFHHRTWQQAADCLAEKGIDLRFTHQPTASALLEGPEAEAFDLLIAEAAPGLHVPGDNRESRENRERSRRCDTALSFKRTGNPMGKTMVTAAL